MLKRRALILNMAVCAAAALLTPHVVARGVHGGQSGPASALEFKGLSQAMAFTGDSGISFLGGSNWSQCTRSRHVSPVTFQRFRVVYQTFGPQGSTVPITDTDFPNSYKFQCGFLQNAFNGTTGIPSRLHVTFSGTDPGYIPGVGPFGHVVSDIIDPGTPTIAGQPFEFFSTVENALGASSPANTLPQQRNASNYLQRYWGCTQAASSLVAANTALTATTITPIGTTRSGAATNFTPCMILIEVPSGTKCIGLFGDSIGYGFGEGVTDFTPSNGDVMGSANGNAGILSRGIYENASGMLAVNFCRGSDGNKNLITAANWKYRLQLMQLANPTHIVNENAFNDIEDSLPGTSGYTSNTNWNLWDVRHNGANTYVCIQAGTGGVSGPSGTGQSIADGSAIWAYIQPTPSTTNQQGSSQLYAWDLNVTAQIKTALPGIPVYGWYSTPNAASSDAFKTTGGQTSNWGTSPSRRTYLNGLRQLYAPGLLGWAGILDLRPYWEYNYASTTGIWVADGVNANTQSYDGAHGNSSGCVLGQYVVDNTTFS